MGDYQSFVKLDDQSKRMILTKNSTFYSTLILSSPDNVRQYYQFITEKAQFRNKDVMHDTFIDLVWPCLNNIFLIHSCMTAFNTAELIFQTNFLLSLAETFIICGFDINTKNSTTGQTLLHLLAQRTDTSGSDKLILKFLLTHGANPIFQDAQGRTALQILEQNILKLQEKNQMFIAHKLTKIAQRWRKEIFRMVPTYQF